MSPACDVAVIGGGPAGCVFAMRMVQLGFDVVLVERARFPRAHLGESLSPGVAPMLASIGGGGVLDEAGAVRVSRVRSNWEGTLAERADPREEGRLVDRGAFDGALLRRAKDVGVRVLQPAQLVGHARSPDGWVLEVEGLDGPLRARFVADATGRAGRLGGVRRATGAQTVALYGYWSGGGMPDQPRIEATDEAWYWGVPIPDGSWNTLVFLDAGAARGDRSRSLDDRLRALLARSGLMDGVRGALRGRARAAVATPYVNEDCVGADHIAVGDAALAIDPLSSSGVQKAIQTALAGAIVANTLLRRPEDADAAMHFYRTSLASAAERHQRWAAQHYAVPAARFDAPFWRARAASSSVIEWVAPALSPDFPLELTPDARLRQEPCLGERFVETRAALVAPLLDGPVAFLGGHELARLLARHDAGMSARELVARWAPDVPEGRGVAIAHWLVEHGVLRRAGGAILGA